MGNFDERKWGISVSAVKLGLTLDLVTGEVAELEPFNAALSKRGAQVERNLAAFEAEWEAAHPGEEPGPVVRARLKA